LAPRRILGLVILAGAALGAVGGGATNASTIVACRGPCAGSPQSLVARWTGRKDYNRKATPSSWTHTGAAQNCVMNDITVISARGH